MAASAEDAGPHPGRGRAAHANLAPAREGDERDPVGIRRESDVSKQPEVAADRREGVVDGAALALETVHRRNRPRAEPAENPQAGDAESGARRDADEALLVRGDPGEDSAPEHGKECEMSGKKTDGEP